MRSCDHVQAPLKVRYYQPSNHRFDQFLIGETEASYCTVHAHGQMTQTSSQTKRSDTYTVYVRSESMNMRRESNYKYVQVAIKKTKQKREKRKPEISSLFLRVPVLYSIALARRWCTATGTVTSSQYTGNISEVIKIAVCFRGATGICADHCTPVHLQTYCIHTVPVCCLLWS